MDPLPDGDMELSPESAAIMSRLQSVGVSENLASLPRGRRAPTGITRRRLGRGQLSEETRSLRSKEHGRRRHSPWQARALSSGEGVIPPAGQAYTLSPQDVTIGWAPAFFTYPGRDAITQGQVYRLVHINFPDWVR